MIGSRLPTRRSIFMNLVGCGEAAFPAAARTDRPELAKVIRRFDAGDVLVVTRLTPRPPPRARWRGDAKPLVGPSFDPIVVDRLCGYRDAMALGPVVVISSAASPPVSEGASTMMILEAIVSSRSLEGSSSVGTGRHTKGGVRSGDSSYDAPPHGRLSDPALVACRDRSSAPRSDGERHHGHRKK
jgi:hypothetical protein